MKILKWGSELTKLFVQLYLFFFLREVSTPVITPISLPAPQIACQQFHFRLETSQNVDEFAMPPTLLWFDIPPEESTNDSNGLFN